MLIKVHAERIDARGEGIERKKVEYEKEFDVELT